MEGGTSSSSSSSSVFLGLVARVWILVEVQQGPAIESVNHIFCITIPGKHAFSGFCCCIGLWVSDQLAWASINAQGIQGTGSLQHTISVSHISSFTSSDEGLGQNGHDITLGHRRCSGA